MTYGKLEDLKQNEATKLGHGMAHLAHDLWHGMRHKDLAPVREPQPEDTGIFITNPYRHEQNYNPPTSGYESKTPPGKYPEFSPDDDMVTMVQKRKQQHAAHEHHTYVDPNFRADINRDVKANGGYEVKPGDSLWKISKDQLGPDASQAEVLAHLKEIAAANGIKDLDQFKLNPGDKLVLPGHTKDGGYVEPSNDGGTVTHKKDGSHHVDDGKGNAGVVWDNGAANVKRADGSGFSRNADGTEHHWGKNAKDNYDQDADGTKHYTDDKGNKTTVYPDGGMKQQNADGTGFTSKADGTSHHWGPKPEDNFDTTADGGKTITRKDGEQVTTWADGTERHQRKDGVGWVAHADGSMQHWGPQKDDNWKEG